MTILERDEVGAIVEKMVETRLRWFEHAERWLVDSVVRTKKSKSDGEYSNH